MEIKGDLDVCRTINARRANEGLNEELAIAAAFNIEMHFANWQRISTDNAGDESVVLPDATTLPEGWKIVIDNISANDNLDVQYDDGVTLLKEVTPATAYQFTLVDNATSNGVWHVNYLEDAAATIANRYCEDFDIADFGALSGGYHTYSVTNGTHGRGADPIVQIMERVATDKFITIPDRVKINVSGDVEIRVTGDDTEDPSIDCRFDGRICLV